MKTKKRSLCMRAKAFLISMVLILTGLYFPSPLKVDTLRSSAETSIENINVQTTWQDASMDYTWNSYSPERKAVKITVTYTSNENKRNYDIKGLNKYQEENPDTELVIEKNGEIKKGTPQSDLIIKIPGIGNALRGTKTLKSHPDVDKWAYTYDENSDLYTFYWREDVSSRMSMDGGFELSWTFDSRSCSDYDQIVQPEMVLLGSEYNLPEMSYHFTNVRDNYNNDLDGDFPLSEHSLFLNTADPDYVWKEYNACIELYPNGSDGWNSRGLKKTRYFVAISDSDIVTANLQNGGEAPSWVTGLENEHQFSIGNGDLKVAVPDNESSWGYSYVDIVYDDTRRQYGFYLFDNLEGDIKNKNFPFYIGHKPLDEKAIEDNSGKDAYDNGEGYRRGFQGFEFDLDKETQLTNEQKKDGIYYTKLTNGNQELIDFKLTAYSYKWYHGGGNRYEPVEEEELDDWKAEYRFPITGYFERLYLDDNNWVFTALPDVTTITPNASITDTDGNPIDTADLSMEQRYVLVKEIQDSSNNENNNSDDSGINEWDSYIMVIEDSYEKMEVQDANGINRNLTADEYNIRSVTMPAQFAVDSKTGRYSNVPYNYEIFAITDLLDDAGVSVATGNTSDSSTYLMPDNTHKIRIELIIPSSPQDGQKIANTIKYSPVVSVNYNLQGDFLADGGLVTNHDELQVKYFDNDNSTHILPEIPIYYDSKTNSLSIDYDKGDDEENPDTRKDMLTNQDTFKIRELQLVLSSEAKFSAFDLPRKNTDFKLWSTITSTAKITSEVDTAINAITVYSTVPKDLSIGKLVDEKTVEGLYIDYSDTKLYKSMQDSQGNTIVEPIDLDNVTVKPTYIKNADSEGNGLIAVQFIFTGASPQQLCLTDSTQINTLTFSYQVFLENSEVWNDNVNHNPETRSYVYIDGSQSSGKMQLKNSGRFSQEIGAMTDIYDFNSNNFKNDSVMAARGTATSEISTEITAWDELAPKRVKSYFSSTGYTLAAFAKIHNSSEYENSTIDSAIYHYRLSLQLGNYAADNLVLYDYLEMEQTNPAEQHLGTLIGLAEWSDKMKAELYYTTESLHSNPAYHDNEEAGIAPYHEYVNYNERIDINGEQKNWSDIWKPFNINTLVDDLCTAYPDKADQYRNNTPSDVPIIGSTNTCYTEGQLTALHEIKAIGIHMTLDNGDMIPSKSHLYADIEMLAPDDMNLDGKKAVNRYYATYKGLKINEETNRVVAANPVEVTYKAVVQSVKLTKIDSVTGAPMEGVTFKLNEYNAENGTDYTAYDWDNPKFSGVTDGQGSVEIFGISKIKYVVQEYKEDALTYKDEQGNDQLYPLVGYYKLNEFILDLELEDNHVPGEQANCDEHFHKNWEKGEEIRHVHVTNQNGTVDNVKVTHTVEYLYYVNDQLQTVILGEDDNLPEEVEKTDIIHHYTVELKNERKTGTATLIKVDSDQNGRPMDKAVYRLYSAAGTLLTVEPYKENGTVVEGKYVYATTVSPYTTYDISTDKDSKITVLELPWSEYYFKEYTAPNGYEIDPYKHYVTVNRESTESGSPVEASQSSETEKRQTIRLRKIDDTTGKPIEGALFNLLRVNDYYEETESIYKKYDSNPPFADFETDANYMNLRTDSNGEIVISDLTFGYYCFKEIGAANGYLYPFDEDETYSNIIHLCETSYGNNNVLTVTMKNTAMPPSLRVYKTDENGIPQENVEFSLYRIMNPEVMNEKIGQSKNHMLSGNDLHYISLDESEILTYTQLCQKPNPSKYIPTYIDKIYLTSNPATEISISDYNELSSSQQKNYTIHELEYIYYYLNDDPNNYEEEKTTAEYNALDSAKKADYTKAIVPMIKQIRERVITDSNGHTESFAESDDYDPLRWNSTYFFYEIGTAQGYKNTEPVDIFTLTTRMAEADPENPNNLLFTYNAVNKQELGKVELSKYLYTRDNDGKKQPAVKMSYATDSGKYAEFQLHHDDATAQLQFVRKTGDGIYEYLVSEIQENGEWLLYKPENESGYKELYAVAVPDVNGYLYYLAEINENNIYSYETNSEADDITTVLKTRMADDADFGTVKITQLPWGAYYLYEITAPQDYKLNPDFIRFSVTEYTAVNMQELKCEDEYGIEGTIHIEKHINALYNSFGEASFLYTITQTHEYKDVTENGITSKQWVELAENEQRTWTRLITITDTNTLSNSALLSGLSAGAYEIQEVDAFRYDFQNAEIIGSRDLLNLVNAEKSDENKLESIQGMTEDDIDALSGKTDEEKENLKNLLVLYQKDQIDLNTKSATVYLDLTTRDTETVDYENQLTDYSRYSHTDNRLNHIISRKLTEVSIYYHGIRRLDNNSVGVDAYGNERSHFYRYDETAQKYYYYLVTEKYMEESPDWNENNIFITLTYDDGTTKQVTMHDSNLSFYLSVDGQEKQLITGSGTTPYHIDDVTPYRFEAAGKHIYTYTIEYTEDGEVYSGEFTISVNLPETPSSYYEVIYSANNSNDTGYFGTNRNKVRNIVRYVKVGDTFVECDRYRNPLDNDVSNYMEPVSSNSELSFIDWDYYSDFKERDNDGNILYEKTTDNQDVYSYTYKPPATEEIPNLETITVYCICDGDNYKEVTKSNDTYTATDTILTVPEGITPERLAKTSSQVIEAFDRSDIETALNNGTSTKTTYVVYAKYSGERAMFVDGRTFYNRVRSVAPSQDITAITAIKYKATKGADAVRADVNYPENYTFPGYNSADTESFIEQYKLTQEIWIWVEDTTLYWFSNDPRPYLNVNKTTYGGNLGDNYFTRWTELSDISGISSWDASLCQNMAHMFRETKITNTNALSKWKTTNATSMQNMFYDCGSLQSVRSLNWEITNVTSLVSMFESCTTLNTIDSVNFFDNKTAENISSKSAQAMFKNCSKDSATSDGIYSNITIDSNHITNFYELFINCSKVASMQKIDIDITSVGSSPNENILKNSFRNCSNLTEFKEVTIRDSSEKAENGKFSSEGMFNSDTLLSTISNFTFESKNINDMSYMFEKCGRDISTGNYANYDLSNMNTSNVATMKYMFSDCQKMQNLKLDSTKFTAAGKLTSVERMFCNCNELLGLDLRGFGNCENLTTIQRWFQNCYKIAYIDLANFETTTKLNDIYAVFNNTSRYTGDTVGANTGCAVFAKGKWENSYTANNGDNYDYFRINMYGKMYKNSNDVTVNGTKYAKGGSAHLDIQNYVEKTDGTPDYSKLELNDSNNRVSTGYFNDANSTYYINWAAAKYGTE